MSRKKVSGRANTAGKGLEKKENMAPGERPVQGTVSGVEVRE